MVHGSARGENLTEELLIQGMMVLKYIYLKIFDFRFVSAGSAMNAAVVPETAGRFKFDSEYNITDDLVRN